LTRIPLCRPKVEAENASPGVSRRRSRRHTPFSGTNNAPRCEATRETMLLPPSTGSEGSCAQERTACRTFECEELIESPPSVFLDGSPLSRNPCIGDRNVPAISDNCCGLPATLLGAVPRRPRIRPLVAIALDHRFLLSLRTTPFGSSRHGRNATRTWAPRHPARCRPRRVLLPARCAGNEERFFCRS